MRLSFRENKVSNFDKNILLTVRNKAGKVQKFKIIWNNMTHMGPDSKCLDECIECKKSY